jgi:hypothetical protein
MSDVEIKARLEKALRKHITWAEWYHLKRTGLVKDYSTDLLSWQELREFAFAELDRLQSFYEDKLREESGELETEYELGAEAPLDLPGGQPDVSSSLSERTVARARALFALNRRCAGDKASQIDPLKRAPIHGTHKPRGGVDGTLPQWVIFLGVEAWVPAEEVKEAYRAHQQALLAEQAPPKTQERAFEVARFVWEEERLHGKRPPWPALWERWNNWRPTKPFKGWREFRTNFLRGEKATRPRYFASNEQMTEAVRSRVFEHSFDRWVSSFRE